MRRRFKFDPIGARIRVLQGCLSRFRLSSTKCLSSRFVSQRGCFELTDGMSAALVAVAPDKRQDLRTKRRSCRFVRVQSCADILTKADPKNIIDNISDIY